MNKNPWKALMPYCLEDKHLFFGRDNEMSQLSSLIEYNQVVTLYGKSGVGKSSLLNAGICPQLIQYGFQPYTIRLKSEKDFDNVNVPFAEIILSRFAKSESIDYSSSKIFCDFFDSYQSYNDCGEKITPVIILDQFEDALISNGPKVEQLLKQIVEWTNNDKAVSSDCHFVISLREDDLYLLEESLDKNRFNSLKLCRYRLRSICRDGAEQIIRKAGADVINDDKVVDKILKVLGKTSIESFEAAELSLMCSQLYETMKMRGLTHISLDLVDNVGISSIKDYYKNIIKELNLTTTEVSSFEREFITENGRRNFISEHRYKKLFRRDICDQLINSQSKYRILSNTNGRIEIVHDLLANAIKDVRDEHQAADKIEAEERETIQCYLLMFPGVLSLILAIFMGLPPILKFVSKKGITNLFDVGNLWPQIVELVKNTSTCAIALVAFCIACVYFAFILIYMSKLLRNIQYGKVYIQALKNYLGVILLVIWFVYVVNGYENWAPGVSILPFFALAIILHNAQMCIQCLIVATGMCWIHPLISHVLTYTLSSSYQLIYIVAYSVLIAMLGLCGDKQLTLKVKVAIVILLVIAGILVCILERGLIFLSLILLLLTIFLIYKHYRNKVWLSIFYIFCLLGICIGVLRINPVLLVKYPNISRVFSGSAIVVVEADSVYIKSAWTGQPWINWPLTSGDVNKDQLLKKGAIGILPINNGKSNQAVSDDFCFFPFEENIEGTGYYVSYSAEFYEGLNGGLEKELNQKLNSIPKNDKYYEITSEILYPIKLSTAKMFNEVMRSVSDKIKSNIPLNVRCNTQYEVIDDTCRKYLKTYFKNKFFPEGEISGDRLTEQDLYLYYRISLCQLINALIQETIDEDNIHNTVRLLSYFVYLNLSENELYQRVNNHLNINMKNDGEDYYNLCINGSIRGDDYNIIHIRDLFIVSSMIATKMQHEWIMRDLDEIMKSTQSMSLFDVARMKEMQSQLHILRNYDHYEFLRSFCQFQGGLLMDILSNRDILLQDNVYKSYFESIVDQLVCIQTLNSNTFLNGILKYKQQNLKEEIKGIKSKIDEQGKLVNEIIDLNNDRINKMRMIHETITKYDNLNK